MKPDALSEVIGAIFLVAIAALAMGIVILFLVSGTLPTNVPSFSGLISNQSKTIYISHEGGDPLYRGQYQILVDGVDRTGSFVGPDPFSLGKNLTYTSPTMPSRVVMIFNTSTGGGTILLSADLTKTAVLRSNWFNCSWHYRKQITVTTGTSGVSSGYTVSLTLNHASLVSAGNSLANGNDVRVARLDGTELPRTLDPLSSWNSPTTTLWFPLGDPIAASSADNSYYLYFGNSNAGSPPADWANIFRIGDEFNDGTLTSTLTTSTNGVATISETGGYALIDLGTANADAGIIKTVNPLPANKQFAVRHKANHVSGGTELPAGCCNPEVKLLEVIQAPASPTVSCSLENDRKRIIAFHRSDLNCDPGVAMTSWIYYNKSAFGGEWKWDGTAFQSGGNVSWAILPMNTYYIWDLISDGTSWQVQVRDAGGSLLTSTTPITWANTYNDGNPYWFYWGEVYTCAYFHDMRSDWFYLRDYVSPEPSTSLSYGEMASC